MNFRDAMRLGLRRANHSDQDHRRPLYSWSSAWGPWFAVVGFTLLVLGLITLCWLAGAYQ